MTDTKNTVSDELATRLETALRAMPDINHGPLDKGMYRRALTDLAVAIGDACRALRASIPGGVGVKLEALAYDWEYIDPKTGHWSYARTPERANHLQAQGVKLTPVYTLEVVRQAQSALDLPPADAQEGGELDIVATAENIARHLSAIDGGRFHGPTYRAAKAGATEGLKCALYAAPSNPVISDEMVEQVFQAVAPHIAGTDWREVRAAIVAALSVKQQSDNE